MERNKERNCYLGRWSGWPLPILSVPNKLNPFEADGVDIAVVLAYHLPYESIKFFTVSGLLSGAEDMGMLQGVHTLVEATSGNTGIALAALAKSFGVPRVKLVVSPDLPEGKRYPLIMAGAELVSPEEGLSAIATARKLGGGGWKEKGWHAHNGCLNLDQYSNPNGVVMHSSCIGPTILKSFVFPPTVFVAGVGTGGTLIGVGTSLRNYPLIENITIVGVLLSPGQEVPGVRDINRMKEIGLPWMQAADEFVEVETRPSYLAALWFNWEMGITPGPSSGLAYLGALDFLEQRKTAGTLDMLRNEQGRVQVVVLFPDGNRPYGDRFMAYLPSYCLRASTAPLPWKKF